jgi:release factor glutamine methyltransferase
MSAPTLEQAVSVGGARRALAAAFRDAGLETPELDARVLVSFVLGLDHGGLVAAAERDLEPNETHRIAALGARRLARESVASIIGCKEFWGLPIQVGQATLVPRPETETVVATALASIDAGGSRARPLRIADLGTGSGCLLVALLTELPNAHGIGTDIDAAALAVACDNARSLGVGERARFACTDFASALAGGFDLVVSNPPYIATRELPSLAPEVQREPRLALDGGEDGLTAYRAIAKDAARLLGPAGTLVLELGVGQARPVAGLLAEAGLRAAEPVTDLAGTPRAIAAVAQPMR